MSNGTLAELPPENIPAGISPLLLNDSSVMLLLPHNKYLLGRGNKWIYSGLQGDSQKNVFLYDSQSIELLNEGAAPTILNAGTVNDLRRKLFANSEPPGTHTGAVLMLRTFMRNIPVFMSEDAEYLDEKSFTRAMKSNPILTKAYWTIRFAMSRSELEAITRLKAWLKTGDSGSHFLRCLTLKQYRSLSHCHSHSLSLNAWPLRMLHPLLSTIRLQDG